MTGLPPSPGRDRRAELLLLIVITIWAANYPLAKYGIGGLNIFVFNGIRYLVAALVLGSVFLGRARWTPIARADWLAMLRAGAIANVVYQVAFIIGLSMTTAGNSAVILATSPLWTLFLSSRMHGDRVPLQVWAGMGISLVGIAFITIGGPAGLDVGRTSVAGDLICVVAAFLWALSTNLQKPLLIRNSPQQVSLVMVAVGSAGLSLIALPDAFTMSWSAVHWSFYVAAVVSGAASIGIANLFWSYGVQRLGPGRTGMFGNLTPALALVLSWAALREELSAVQVAGAAVTLAGIWYARR